VRVARERYATLLNPDITMTFTYSICHPDKKEIEFRNQSISRNEVLEIAKNYPWKEELDLMESINQDKVFYNPSLDFKCLANGQSFCLTAIYDEQKKLMFSLWYNRPKRVKVLFGLFGETEKMIVDEFWSLDFDGSIKHLEYFVDKNYLKIEELYKK